MIAYAGPDPPFLATAGLLSLVPFLIALPDSMASNGFRYLYPLAVPVLLYGIATRHVRFGRARLVAAAVLAVAILPVQIVQWRNVLAYSAELQGLESWVSANVPSTSTIATHDAGILSMGSQRVVDLVGLKTPESALEHEAVTWPSCGASRGEALRAILRQHPADYLVVTTGWDDLYHISAALSATEMVKSPSRNGYVYKVYRLPPRVTAGGAPSAAGQAVR